MISLERLEELEYAKGEPLSPDELLELVQTHRLAQRLDRTLDGQVRRTQSIQRDLRAAFGAPEPASLVAAEEGASA